MWKTFWIIFHLSTMVRQALCILPEGGFLPNSQLLFLRLLQFLHKQCTQTNLDKKLQILVIHILFHKSSNRSRCTVIVVGYFDSCGCGAGVDDLAIADIESYVVDSAVSVEYRSPTSISSTDFFWDAAHWAAATRGSSNQTAANTDITNPEQSAPFVRLVPP